MKKYSLLRNLELNKYFKTKREEQKEEPKEYGILSLNFRKQWFRRAGLSESIVDSFLDCDTWMEVLNRHPGYRFEFYKYLVYNPDNDTPMLLVELGVSAKNQPVVLKETITPYRVIIGIEEASKRGILTCAWAAACLAFHFNEKTGEDNARVWAESFIQSRINIEPCVWLSAWKMYTENGSSRNWLDQFERPRSMFEKLSKK